MIVEFHTTIGKIAESTHGILICGDPNEEIDSITTDSRKIGNRSLYVPLIGERYNGHQFIEKLIKDKSIAGFLTMKNEYSEIAGRNGINAILCDDTLKA